MSGPDDSLGTNLQAEAYRHGVQGQRQPHGERDRTEIVARVIFRLPAFHIDRSVFAHRIRGQAGFERGEINERLESRARLALRRSRAVELAFGVIAAADQRLDRAFGVKRDKGSLADAERRTFAIELFGERFSGRRLQRDAERRRDRDIFIDRADRIVERVHYEIGSVIDRAGVSISHGLRGMNEGEHGHRIGYDAFLNHCRDD